MLRRAYALEYSVSNFFWKPEAKTREVNRRHVEYAGFTDNFDDANLL